ncbi:MAG: biosynthetic peptidoglycan transglycosylase [Actinomycetes bacterium]
MRLLKVLVLTGVGVLVLGIAAFAVVWVRSPGVGDAPSRVAAVLAAGHGTPLSTLPNPDRVGDAAVATEDAHFWSEPGVDPAGLVRAVLGPLLGPGDQGGATIPMQLAKLLYTPDHPGLGSKVTDLVLAVKLVRAYPKTEILAMYLDAAYYGHGYTGVVDAARGYFGVRPSQLSWGQAALVAGLVQAPSAFDPTVHAHRAISKEHHVLDRLVATGVLTAAQAQAAWAAPLHPVVTFRG